MSTLPEYREQLGWSKVKLAEEAGVTPQIISKAEDGEPITFRSATKIAQALSRGFDKVIMAQHIEGVNVRKES
ncbi:MAG TPA: helix-turn-helix transcriptional regulator [Ktedonobacteraceae bacterium]|nr:helix-turn-helix transcriptional regulator [Ktedonobacteraceae bacterium]